MPDITSFNQLFWEAKLAGLRLSMFYEEPRGGFVAQFQRGPDIFEPGTNAAPFDALLAAFRLATKNDAPPAPWFE